MKLQKSRLLPDISDKIFLIILLLATIGMIYFGTVKEGYHLDEVYSYGLANSEYLPFMHMGYHDYNVKDWMMEYGAGESLKDLFTNLKKDFLILKANDFRFYQTEIYQQYLRAQANSADTKSTTWMTGQDYRNYLTATKENSFNYASVYYNQRGDVHPPFYYILLHTISSLFCGIHSKWFGLVINIVSLDLTLILMYRMVKKYLGGGDVALCAVIGYCFSCAIISTAMLIRMYALLTLIVMATCLIHVKIAHEDYRVKGKNGWCLALVILLGFLTHYYYVLYAIAIAGTVSVCMAIHRKWRVMIRYWLTLMFTAAGGLCVWPYAIRHVFSGYRGREALGNLKNNDLFWINIRIILNYSSQQALGRKHWLMALPVLAVIICFGVVMWKGKGKIPARYKTAVEKACIVIIPYLFYLQITSQIVPMLTDRYVHCLFPFMSLFVIESIYLAIRALKGIRFLQGKNIARLRGVILAACTAVLLLFNNMFHTSPSNLFIDGQESYVVEDGTDCVYVLPDGSWNHSSTDIPILAKCENVAVVYQSNLAEIGKDYQPKPGAAVLIAVQNELQTEPVLEQAKQDLHLEQLTETARRNGPEAVWIWLR